MKFNYKTFILSIILCFLSSSPLMAEPINNAIIRVPLLTAYFKNDKTVNRVEVKRIDFAPMQQTGYHFHPCPVITYITKGSIYFQIEGQKAKIYHAGEVIFEPANVKILHYDNISKTEGSSFIALYLLSKSDKEIIKMLE